MFVFFRLLVSLCIMLVEIKIGCASAGSHYASVHNLSAIQLIALGLFSTFYLGREMIILKQKPKRMTESQTSKLKQNPNTGTANSHLLKFFFLSIILQNSQLGTQFPIPILYQSIILILLRRHCNCYIFRISDTSIQNFMQIYNFIFHFVVII